MLVLTHSLVGGLVASKIKNPLVTSPFLFGFHFILDRIPHWDLGVGFRQRKKIINFFLGLIDLGTSLVVCWLFFQKGQALNFFLWLGIFFSILPDFLEFPALFLNWRFFPFSTIEKIHSEIFHRKTSFWKGIIPQIIIIFLVFMLK